MSRAAVVLGSATPSVESYYLAEQGEYKLLTLTKRAKENSRLAGVHIVDLREELAEGNRSIFSRRLKGLIEDRLANRQQVMLFMNRRGYAGFVSCRSCGKAMKCPHCDVSLTYHKNGRLKCHYCGFERAAAGPMSVLRFPVYRALWDGDPETGRIYKEGISKGPDLKDGCGHHGKKRGS